MKFFETPIAGAYRIELERQTDDRGSFSRVFCAREFEGQGLSARFVQASLSTNARRGTLRGLHYSVHPSAEVKLVRCTQGSVFDVIVDIRPGSPTFLRWWGTTLSAANGDSVYVPEGVAHGFQTLENDSHVFYQMNELFDPTCARGVRWNDLSFGVDWPAGERFMSERDRTYPDFSMGRGNPGT